MIVSTKSNVKFQRREEGDSDPESLGEDSEYDEEDAEDYDEGNDSDYYAELEKA